VLFESLSFPRDTGQTVISAFQRKNEFVILNAVKDLVTHNSIGLSATRSFTAFRMTSCSFSFQVFSVHPYSEKIIVLISQLLLPEEHQSRYNKGGNFPV